MANIRTIDYGGFNHATGSAATGSGFMIWSGSMQLSKSLAYASQKTQYYGSGMEVIAHSGSYLRFQTDTDGTGTTSSLDIRTNRFFLGSDNSFISGSGDGTIGISSSNFELGADGAIVMQGTITAEAGGTIGGFAIGTDNLTANNFILNTTEKRLTLGTGNSIFIADADDGIHLGNATFASAPFSVDLAGALKATNADISGKITATSGEIGGFVITSNAISSSNGNLKLKSTGEISGSQVDFTGGKIGDWRIDGSDLVAFASNGSTKAIELKGDSTPEILINAATTPVSNFVKIFRHAVNWGIQGKSGGDFVFQLGSTNQIAGWTFTGTALSKTNADGGVKIDAGNKVLTFRTGSTDTTEIVKIGQIDTGKFGILGLDSNDTTKTIFKLGEDGNEIAGFTFDDGKFSKGTAFHLSTSTDVTDEVGFISSSQFKVSPDGRITGSEVLFGDKSGNNYVQYTGNTLTVRGDITVDSIRTPATIGGSPSTISNASSSINSDGFAKFVSASIANWEISDKFIRKIDGTSHAYILSDGTGLSNEHASGKPVLNFFNSNSGVMVNVGNIYKNSGNTGFALFGNYGGNIKLFEVSENDGTGTVTAQIAGWTFDENKLTGGNLILNKEGSIQSSDYVSNFSGFSLTGDSGSFLEVENARIRGTLATAVFEKETVNAVGGQLYVANSTVLTGSVIPGQNNDGGEYALTDTTMSVVNVTGFEQGEILSMKKINSTGFSTEYVLVNSSSRQDANSETNFAGNLMVTRGYGTSATVTSVSQSLGEAPGAAQSYSGSQVIVSTGKQGTGFIRLNANPNDQTTPYIDIVERTGSGIYDLSLKTRLGDLSGINDPSFTDDVTGFGIYTENGYFKGKIEVTDPAGDSMLESFGGPSGSIIPSTKLVHDGEVSGSQWYQTTTTRHQVKNGILMVSSSNNSSWNGELRSKQRFHRSGDHSLVFDVVPRDITGTSAAPRFMIGWGDVASASSDVNPGATYKNTAHAVYFSSNDVTVYHGGAPKGALANNSLTVGDKYRFIVTPLNDANKSARYQMFKYPNLTGSIGDVTLAGEAFTKDDLDVSITALKNTHTLDICNIQVTAPGQMSTVIEGDKITTGKIVSTNYGATQGTEMDLDGEIISIGGTGASTEGIVLDGSTNGQPKFFVGDSTNFLKFNHTSGKLEINTDNFDVNSSGDVSMTGQVTAQSGNIAGWTINNESLDGGNLHLNKNGYISSSVWKISSSADATDPVGFISTSEFKVSSDGVMTASAGLIAGFTINNSPNAVGVPAMGIKRVLESRGSQGEGFALVGMPSGSAGFDIPNNSLRFFRSGSTSLTDRIVVNVGSLSNYNVNGGVLSNATFGMQILDAAGSEVFGAKYKELDQTFTASIAGWRFNNQQFNNFDETFIMHKTGYLQSGTKWKISSSAANSDPAGFISSSEFKVSADGRVTASGALIDGNSKFVGNVTVSNPEDFASPTGNLPFNLNGTFETDQGGDVIGWVGGNNDSAIYGTNGGLNFSSGSAVTQNAKVSVIQDSGSNGSQVLQYDYTGTQGEVWTYTREAFPVDTSHTYRMTVRVKLVSGATSGKIHAGFACLDANGAWINESPGTHRWFGSNGNTLDDAGEWQIYYGTITGEGSGAATKFKTGTAFVRPVFILGFNDVNAKYQIDYMYLENLTTGETSFVNRKNDTGVKVKKNFSNFNTVNNGEMYLHGYDITTGEGADVSGSIFYRGGVYQLPAKLNHMLTAQNVGTTGDNYYIIMDTRNANEAKNPHVDGGPGFKTHTSTTSSLAAAKLNGTQWQFDPNGPWTNFTPDDNFCIIGRYNTSAADNISKAEVFYNAVPCDINFTGSVGSTAEYVNPVLGGVTNINGNMITTGVIKSSNFSTTQGSRIDLDDGEIIMGGTTNPGFQVDTSGLVVATNFAEKIVTVTSANSSSYFGDVTVNSNARVKILFDGSGGGEVTNNIKLACLPRRTNGVQTAIGDVALPNQATGITVGANIIVAVEGVEFDPDGWSSYQEAIENEFPISE